MKPVDTGARRLCAREAIPEGGALAVDSGAGSLVLLRRGDSVWAYRNRCPHFGVPLDFDPGEIITYDGQVVMCAHHCALFRFEDGACIDGPCEGAALDAVPVEVAGGMVFAAR